MRFQQPSRRAMLSTALVGLSRLPEAAIASIPAASAHSSAQIASGLIRNLVAETPEIGGTLLRLAFHDCVTRDGAEGGSNGSVRFELDWRENRHLDVAISALDPIHQSVGSDLSYADLIVLAGAEAVAAAGGPTISMRELGTGRIDASKADPRSLRAPVIGGRDPCPPAPAECRSRISSTLPEPGLSTDGMRAYFRRLGFSDDELVALCGAHSLGRHASLLGVSRECLRMKPAMSDACIETGKRLPFVSSHPDQFDNSYFAALLRWRAQSLEPGEAYFIPTDVTLVLDPVFRRIVMRFARDESAFFNAWRRAYVKLAHIGFTQGQTTPK